MSPPARRDDAPGWVPTLLALALVTAAAVLLAAAFRYPFVESRFALALPEWIPDVLDLHERIRQWLIREGQIPVGEQHLSDIVVSLASDGEWFIALAIVLFSIVFPILKIVLAALVLTFARTRPRERRVGLRVLELTSKWSMADVFIVAVVIVFFKAEGFHFEIEPRPGLYCFGASALASGLAVTFTRALFGEHPAT